MQKDVERYNGAEESCLVDGREAIRLLVQKSAILTEAADDGNGDGDQNGDNEASERR